MWHAPHPPRGADNCKDCALLNRVLDFEANLRANDAFTTTLYPGYRDVVTGHEYDRFLAHGVSSALKEALDDNIPLDQDGGLWSNWEF